MQDNLTVNNIKITDKRIEYDYSFDGKWKEVLNCKEKMFVEYEEAIESIPKSIAIIPFLANILPIAWIYDLKITINELDQTFYESIPKIKQGYEKMYPSLEFKGQIIPHKIVTNTFNNNKSAVLFSGGVDAFNTLINHIDEKPDLITIFGADVTLSDTTAIKKIKEHHSSTAKDLNLTYKSVYSNFRTSLNSYELTKHVNSLIKAEWWHDFEHGIALIGLTAPLSYIHGYKKVYIASSFTKDDIGNYTCASDPIIDNYFKHSSSITIHDGYEFNRQDKIHNICTYVKNTDQPIKLRVCWISTGGDNCCQCEKCYRTIMGIIAEKQDPSKFGFNFTKKEYQKMIKYLKNNLQYNIDNNILRYQHIQETFIKNYTTQETPNELKWFRTLPIGSKQPDIKFKTRLLGKKVKNKILK